MARLDVQAVWDVSGYHAGSPDILAITVGVSDADGNPVTTLVKENFTLLSLGDLFDNIDLFGHGTLMGGFYSLFVERQPPGHFMNGASPIGISVVNGPDHGQTIIKVEVSGRPLPDGNS
jgi:hypothetical protein